jgi:flagellar motor switch protein FliN/FliY
VKTFFQCWVDVASALFSQALAGEPELGATLLKPLGERWFGFAASLSGDFEGKFVVVLDGAILDTPLLGEGVDQKAGWSELLREAADAATGDLLATGGAKCQVAQFRETTEPAEFTGAFQLRSEAHTWPIWIADQVRAARAEAAAPASVAEERQAAAAPLSPGLELLLDVELEASLRFGSREMPLGDILDLGPGDVVELDRNVSDPVDLIVGDKIVGRGEVVLVNGNFALRVTEVAAPRKRLESIRCLF